MAELAKPGDYFIGIAEFFGSLAPGTVLVALLWRLGAVPGFSNQPRDLLGFEGTAILAALIIGGYLAGNVVSVFGAKLDLSYDAVRKRLYPPERDNAYPAAKRLCEDELGDQASAMNAFQWARTVLAI